MQVISGYYVYNGAGLGVTEVIGRTIKKRGSL